MRILVVEDEHKVARALREGLEGESYDVSIAHTGEEGFYLVSVETFDVIVLDLLLPGRNGLEILRQFRKRRRRRAGAGLPLVETNRMSASPV